MNRKLIFSGLILALCAASAGAYAKPPHPGGEPPIDLKAIDTDGDGKISTEEWTAARTAEFAKIDIDSSGGLTLDELEADAANRVAEHFAALDADGSGELSSTEFVGDKTGKAATMAGRVFNLADKDDSEGLSKTEFETLSPGAGGLIRHFAMLDQDGNDVVSLEEFLVKPEKPQGKGKPGPR